LFTELKDNNITWYKLSEILLVYGAAIAVLWILGSLEKFGEWQTEIFGRKILNSIGSHVIIPGLLMFWYGRNNSPSVFTKNRAFYALKTGTKALAIFLPLTIIFPIVMGLGLDIRSWGGGAIIGTTYILAAAILLLMFRNLPEINEQGFSRSDATGVMILIAVSAVLLLLVRSVYPLIEKTIIALLFVGFLEEFFFRGYLQTRLNEIFGKPFVVLNLHFGWGLILASLLFGLAHVFSPGNPWHWAWGGWTFTSGLCFGILREKSGSFLASALVHGLTVLPAFIFS